MASDPYELLGVKKDATQDAIQKAYRRLAKKLHPDLNPGNKQAENKFKEVSAAYNLLSDPETRKKFDDGEIDASGAERPRQRYYRDFADAEAENPYARGANFGGAEDIFSDLFGQHRRGNVRLDGEDAHYRLSLDFLDAVNGGKQKLTLPDGATLDVTVPPGIVEGQVLRLRGKGHPGIGGGSPGDALIAIEVRPHRLFKRDGDNIRIELPVSLREAVLGGKVRVPTTSGAVTMTVPKASNTGTVLRIKGRGVKRPDGTSGDEYVTLRVMLPKKLDPALERFVAEWQPAESHSPREEMGLE